MDFVLCSQLPLLPLPHLKDLCRSLGLRITGSKSALRERIANFLQTSEGRLHLSDVTKLLSGSEDTLVVPEDNEAAGEKTECICRVKDERAGFLCERCGALQHSGCLGAAAALKPYECPRCQIEQMDPFEPVLEFLMPPVVVPTCHIGEFSYNFTYPPPTEARVRDDSTQTYVQLRCLAINKDGYTHQWPTESTVLLDGRPLFTSVPQHSNQSRKRKDHPLDCSYVLTGGRHTLQFSKKKEEKIYAMSVVVVQRLSVQETIDRLAAGPRLSLAEGQLRVASLLTTSADVSASTLRLSLLCPLTHLKPDTPVRGIRCKHLQCFDFQSYVTLQASAKVNRWRCPICKAFCGALMQDLFVKAVVTEARAVDDCEVVEFNEDGSATLVRNEVVREDDDEQANKENDGQPGGIKRTKTQGKGTLSWTLFFCGCVSDMDLYGSEAYASIAKVTIDRMKPPHKALLPPIDPRMSTQSESQLFTTRSNVMVGSQGSPIDLDA